jgi:hypothetical protein
MARAARKPGKTEDDDLLNPPLGHHVHESIERRTTFLCSADAFIRKELVLFDLDTKAPLLQGSDLGFKPTLLVIR